MQKLAKWTVLAWMSLAAMGLAQDAQTARTPARVIVDLKAEAKRTAKAELSKLFTWLEEQRHEEQLRLSPSQADLIRRLDLLTRDIIQSWLLRDLDANPVPAASTLEQRISERGVRFRSRLVGHAESLAIEGILSSQQAQIVRKAIGRRVEPLLSGHNGLQPLVADANEKTVTQLVEDLRSHPDKCLRAGEISFILLGRPGIREEYPDGIEKLDPVRQKLARLRMPKIEIPDSQRLLVERMDELTIAILRDWATRGLDRIPLPPRRELAERWQLIGRFSDNLFAHAEVIMSQGVLTPLQVDHCMVIIWKQMGYRALQDPILVSRLRMTKWQRDEVRHLLNEMELNRRDSVIAAVNVRPLLRENPEMQGQLEQLEHSVKQKEEQLDNMIWEILSSAQIRVLQRIFNDSATPNRTPIPTKPKPRRPVRSS